MSTSLCMQTCKIFADVCKLFKICIQLLQYLVILSLNLERDFLVVLLEDENRILLFDKTSLLFLPDPLYIFPDTGQWFSIKSNGNN